MKTVTILLILLLAAGLLGCDRQPEPQHIVILPDVSGSIGRESLQQAFNAINELVGHLQRGSRISIIPILGDAEAKVSGQIIRFQIPPNRQAYDSDLTDFRFRLKAALKKMETSAVVHPEPKTDILGSIVLAQQEFQMNPNSRPLLVILSDFIQEDSQTDFTVDNRLLSPATALKFAQQTVRANPLNFNAMPVYLGLLQSNEYTHLMHNRKLAIQEFWLQYFHHLGTQPRFITDGVGLLKIVLMSWEANLNSISKTKTSH